MDIDYRKINFGKADAKDEGCAGRSSGSTPASQIRIYLQDRNHPVLFAILIEYS